MKPTLIFMLFPLLIASCDNYQSIEEPKTQTNAKETIFYTTSSLNRGLDEAIKIADDARGILDSPNSSRAFINREIDKDNGIRYILSPSESRSSSADTLLYIINYKDNAGFAVISAKRSTDPVIAVIESGRFSSLEECDNPGFSMCMEMAIDYVTNAPVKTLSTAGDDSHTLYEIKSEQTVLVDDTISHKTLDWGQEGIYGKYCSNLISGCGSTAAGIAMSYFRFPESIELRHNNNEFLDLSWDAINRHSEGFRCWSCPDGVHYAIGRLLREIGYRAGADYKESGTSIGQNKLRNTLKELGFQIGSLNKYDNLSVRNSLKNGNLVIISGFNEANKGHTWVIDGYVYKVIHRVEYVRPMNSSEEWTEIENVTSTIIKNRHNWGWDGDYNGYMDSDIFKLGNIDLKYNVHFFTIKN